MSMLKVGIRQGCLLEKAKNRNGPAPFRHRRLYSPIHVYGGIVPQAAVSSRGEAPLSTGTPERPEGTPTCRRGGKAPILRGRWFFALDDAGRGH
jgi:hypothetical protein